MSSNLPLNVRRELWARIWQRLLQPTPKPDTNRTENRAA